LKAAAALPALSLMGEGAASAAFPPDVRLIAHRGGVTDTGEPENSPASLEAAIDRGYWMVEVDVRRTRDGRAILQHDPDFRRFYGVPRKVLDMDWKEIHGLRTKQGGSRPMAFEELCERCNGRIRLMLDVKNEPNPIGYYREMERALVTNNLLDTSYILTDVETERYFQGRMKQAASIAAFRQAVARGDGLSDLYVFDDASCFTPETVDFVRSRQCDLIGAANLWGYEGGNVMARAKADLAKGYAAGVRAFQIDSVFDRFFRDRAFA